MYLTILFLVSATAAASSPAVTPTPTSSPTTEAAHNSTTTMAGTSPHYVLLQQPLPRKVARNFQPSAGPTAVGSDAAKKKINYGVPEPYSFAYDKTKLSSKYSSAVPTTIKTDRSHDEDYYSQNMREMPLVSPNSRHGYGGHYEDHGEYGAVADDEELDHYSHGGADLYPHHHHHGHHHHHPVHHYVPPPAIYYPAHHHEKHDEYSKLGLLALAKIVLAKIKALGLFKIILLLLAKIPLIFLKIALKFFFLFKAVKLFKLLTFSALFPLILVPLIPLLFLPLLLLPLAPLLLIPLALPLLLLALLFLPIPVMTPMGNANRAADKKTTSRRRRDAGEVWRELDASDDFLMLTRTVLESQQCLERLACKMAARQDSGTYNSFILWLLEKVRAFAPSRLQDRLTSYIDAYRTGSKRSKMCVQKYTCDKPKFMVAHADTYYNLL
ncbi:uncharacterized protein [Periplaneta americana]|uniref:uncharacterized protein n=1 Tax=Periplaneta americana TaxID=6978 RepID=UPI0037E72269